MMHRLPVEAYTSEDWYRREQELIFSRVWRYAGFVEDLENSGDYLTVQAGLHNIIVVVGKDGSLRAFHNRCRHRGTQLLRTVGKRQKAIRCPYHDWTYDLEGKLISVPELSREFGDLDKGCLGLQAASVDVWRGMIFVHSDPNAPSLQEWFSEIEPHLGPHKVDELVEYPDARKEYEVRANWKVVVENYIDVYHLAHLHSGTLSMYQHSEAEYGFHGDHFAFKEPLAAEYQANLEKNAPMPLVVPADQAAAYVPMLFPGIGLSETESDWSTFIVTPLAPDRTKVENRVRVKNASDWAFMSQEWQSAGFWKNRVKGKYQESTKDDPLVSGDLTAEDIYACEQQQESFRSPGFQVGPLARGEEPIVEHQNIVLRYLGGSVI